MEFYSKIYIKDSIIDQQIARRGILCTTVNVFQPPLPFYASKIINTFLNSKYSSISANHNKWLDFWLIVKSFYSFLFIQCRIYFKQICLEFKQLKFSLSFSVGHSQSRDRKGISCIIIAGRRLHFPSYLWIIEVQTAIQPKLAK